MTTFRIYSVQVQRKFWVHPVLYLLSVEGASEALDHFTHFALNEKSLLLPFSFTLLFIKRFDSELSSEIKK